MNEWHSVNDRLPEEPNYWVLVYADGAIACRGFMPGKGFQDWELCQAPGLVLSEITHWMELPNPPEEA